VEVLNHLLFVEPDKGLWGIIGFGIFIAVGSLWYDKYLDKDASYPVNTDGWH